MTIFYMPCVIHQPDILYNTLISCHKVLSGVYQVYVYKMFAHLYTVKYVVIESLMNQRHV